MTLVSGALFVGLDAAVADGEFTVSLRDGQIVRGRTSAAAIEVQTIYGKLTVPLSDVVRLRFGESMSLPASSEDEVDARAFSIRGVVDLVILELKTPNGTLKIAKRDIASVTAAGAGSAPASFPPFGSAIGVRPSSEFGSPFGGPSAGFGIPTTAASPVYLHSRDPNAEPVAGERLLSTVVYEGSFHVYGHEPVPQQNGFDYYISPVKLDSELRGKRVRISRVEVSVKGKSNGAVINWDVEALAGPSGDFGLPAGQFTKSNADPMRAYKMTAPVHTRFTYEEVNFTRSVIIPAGTRKELALNDGLRAQIFLWTADNRNCNLDIQSVTVRFFGETL
jgi:hypothetical protein